MKQNSEPDDRTIGVTETESALDKAVAHLETTRETYRQDPDASEPVADRLTNALHLLHQAKDRLVIERMVPLRMRRDGILPPD